MIDNTHNSRRIAKNTIFLYIRMLLMMIVTLYTSREVLYILGIEDYGIYNVVGGVVAMFSIISGSLSAAISRFISFELGKENYEKLVSVFSSSVTIQLFLSGIVFILAELIGVWFLNVKMNIPDNRIISANWVFQFSILTFIINLLSVPYNATIIAHEKMSAFAYISILEAIARLSIVYMLLLYSIDRLILYAILMTIVTIIIQLVYVYYCKKHFKECTYHFIFDKGILKKMFSFAGWNFIGATSAVLRDHGGNIVLNLFCGPSVNAARSIAYQVNGAIHGFVYNFMMAINPQITKSYASGDKDYMMTLIFQGARFSFYILLLLSLPVIINANYLLSIYLKVVPAHTTVFVQLVLIFAMSESISNPLITAMLATGNIRNYQILVGGLQMMNLPISYLLLKNGCVPEIVMYVSIVISQCCLIARLFMLRGMIGLSVKRYILDVYFNVIIVSCLSAIIPVFIYNYIDENFLNFILSFIVCILVTSFVIFYVGCSMSERDFILLYIRKLKNIVKKYITDLCS